MKRIEIDYRLVNNICSQCSFILVRNDEWDQAYDRIDKNSPSNDITVKQIYKEKIPMYYCNQCNAGVFVKI